MPHTSSHQAEFPFQAFLREEPRATFLSALPRGLRGGRRRFAESQFQNLLNLFEADLGQQARTGQIPNLQFQNFVTPERIRSQILSFSPSQRGLGGTRFAPPVEFRF
jgi:hypothetical protein